MDEAIWRPVVGELLQGAVATLKKIADGEYTLSGWAMQVALLDLALAQALIGLGEVDTGV